MTFTSFHFIAFVALVMATYALVPYRWRRRLLLVASYLFIAATSVSYLGWLVFVTLTAYLGARAIVMLPRKGVLASVIGILVVPLVSVKYAAFVATLLGQPAMARITDAALPLGLSFYTFQAVSYVVEVFRGRVVPGTLRQVALYLAYFPKLVAGPIERAGSLLPQLKEPPPITARSTYLGLKYMLWGFFCKLVVADNIAGLVDRVLQSPREQAGSSLLVAFGLYSFQLYFDFAGYTAIAIGVARCFDIRLSENFRLPYLATSLRDFWRRWHITLSSWFRDYVYMPLGGNTTTGVVRVLQLLTVFLVSGLWHGAGLNFVLWGGFHGTSYLLEERLRHAASRWQIQRFQRLRHGAKIALTFSVVMLGWVFFRLSSLAEIQVVLARVCFVDTTVPYLSVNPALARGDALLFMAILGVAIMLDRNSTRRQVLESIPETGRQIGHDLVFCNTLIIPLVLLGDLGIRDFVYYGF